MTTQEWQIVKKHMPNYFTCSYTWAGILLGSVAGVILLESIIKLIGQ